MGIITRRMLRSGKRPPKNTPPTITVPIAAARLGYTRLAFEDNFDSFSTIDTADSGASDFKWYVKRPYGWPSMAANEYSVANSILKITQANAYANWGLCTVHAGTKAGYSMKFGYAEASIRFDPSAAVMSDGWPAFWAKSSMDLTGTYGTRNAELDIFEAWHPDKQPYDDLFCGGIHDWQADGSDYNMGDNGLRTLHGTAWNEWRRYACLWQPSQCNWYLDDQLLFTQQYSAASAPAPNPQNNPVGAFSILDEETPGMALILGCGSNWVLEVDWVRLWAGV